MAARRPRPGCLLSDWDQWRAKRAMETWVRVCGSGSINAAAGTVYRDVEFDGTPIGEWVKQREEAIAALCRHAPSFKHRPKGRYRRRLKVDA